VRARLEVILIRDFTAVGGDALSLREELFAEAVSTELPNGFASSGRETLHKG